MDESIRINAHSVIYDGVWSQVYACVYACVCVHVASCGSIGVEWFGNAVNCSYGIVNHQRLQHTQ